MHRPLFLHLEGIQVDLFFLEYLLPSIITFKLLWVLFDGDVNYTQITDTNEQIIRIATTDYLINGGNGYTMLTNNGINVLDGPGGDVAGLLLINSALPI